DPGADTADLPEQVMVHCGSAAVAAHVRPLDARHARLALTRALPLRVGDRLILREPGAERIPAGAVVLDPAPPELRRRGAARRRAEVLAATPEVPDLGSELRRRGVAHVDDLRAFGVAGVPAADETGGWLLDPGALPGLVERLVSAVEDHDRRDPLDPGLPAEAARRGPRPTGPARPLTGHRGAPPRSRPAPRAAADGGARASGGVRDPGGGRSHREHGRRGAGTARARPRGGRWAGRAVRGATVRRP